MHVNLTPSQCEDVETLLSLGTGIEEDKAVELLKKYAWNIEQAASAMFSEPSGPQPTWDLPPDDSRAVVPISTSRLRNPSPPPRARNRRDSPDSRGALNSTTRTVPSQNKSAYIDLTAETNDADDEEELLRKAMAASLESENQPPVEVVHGPLNKGEVDPLRPITLSGSNAAFSQEDHNLSRALEASLVTSLNADVYIELPNEQRIRPERYPVAIRTSDVRSIGTVLLFQALFAVPQVREVFSNWRADQSVANPLEFDRFLPEADRRLVEFFQQMFAYMDLGQQSDLNVDGFLSRMNLPLSDPNDPGSNFKDIYDQRIALMCERAFCRSKGIPDHISPHSSARLFLFRGVSGSDNDEWTLRSGLTFIPDEASILVGSSSDYDPNSLENSLYTHLLKPPVASWFLTTSAVLTFRVTRYDSVNSIPVKYLYPKRLFLDPYMAENRVAVKEKVDQKDAWNEKMEAIARRKDTLTRSEGKDTLADLRKTIFYLENVADTKGDPQRRKQLDELASKLKEVILAIEKELKVSDEQLKELRSKSETIFNVPQWQQSAYDLRAVLVHDGIAGREHSYVYTQDPKSGKWFKTCDATITEVTEDDVLNDSSGLHLSAGPYVLVYSRILPDDWVLPSSLPWPRDICEKIQDHDMKFRANLPPDLATKVVELAIPEADESPLLSVIGQEGQTKPSSPAPQEPLPQQPALPLREHTSMSDPWIVDTGMQSRATTPSPVISSKGVSPRGSPIPRKSSSSQAVDLRPAVFVETTVTTSPVGATGVSRAKSDATRPRTSTVEAGQHSLPSRSFTMKERSSKESRGSTAIVIASSRDKDRAKGSDVVVKPSERKKRDSDGDKA